MRVYILLLFLLLTTGVFSQTSINGKVVTTKGIPIEGANIYLAGTYDGSTSDAEGKFHFNSYSTGEKTLEISYLGFTTYKITADISKFTDLLIILQKDPNTLDTVVLTAGTFSVGGESKLSALKPLDVFTTANAVGDIMGAFQTLPGTSTVTEDGRLFVRGGDASETQVFIDGIRVFTPYTPTANNNPTRGRFSPSLFDGISLSTGGYAAEYGQALSSVLLLNTKGEELHDKLDLSMMNIGGGLGYTKKWEATSISLNTFYTNLGAYKEIFPDRNNWQKPYESIAGEAIIRQRIGKGLLKFYTALDASNFKLTQKDINSPLGISFALNNLNYYTNISYNEECSRGWSIVAGGSYSNDNTKISIEEVDINDVADIRDIAQDFHLKIKLRKHFDNYLKWNFGAEHFINHFKETYSNPSIIGIDKDIKLKYRSPLTAVFNELEVLLSRNLAFKLGVRGEYSAMFKEFTVSPRFSVAYKTGEQSQISFAYGKFYQLPDTNILKYSSELSSSNAEHYIFNYQYTFNKRLFRAEIYRKSYHDLIRYSDAKPIPGTAFYNTGKAYAQGLDIFWRDNYHIRNLEYWFSYSYLDTKRQYKDYTEMATPAFANKHNLSLVAKYWKGEWRSQIGFSYQYASGRTYTDFNKPGFLQDKTKSYNSLSINWSFLISQQKILYASISNVLGFKNITGYNYANTPATNGSYARETLRPAMDQFFFIGYFWTISSDKKINQLKNL